MADANNVVNADNIVSRGEVTNQTNPTKGKKQTKMTKSKNLVKPKNYNFPLNFKNTKVRAGFLTLKARLAFTQLRQAFKKALIFHYFDLKCYIWIKTDASGYAIHGVVSQLAFGIRLVDIITKTNLGQWHLLAFFFKKMIPAKT